MRKEPAYRRIVNELRAGILSGELPEGTRLPSQREIAARYGVSYPTAVRVFDTLRAEGLIVSRPASGFFVQRFARIRRLSPRRLSAARWGQGQTIQDHDTRSRSRTVDVEVGETDASGLVADAFGLAAGDQVVYRSRRYTVDDRPVQLAMSYLPVEIARGSRITYTDTGPGGIYARLAELGHAPVRFVERIVGRAPVPDEAVRLEMPLEGARIFEIVRFAYTAEGRCVEVNRMILDASIYELEYEFAAETAISFS